MSEPNQSWNFDELSPEARRTAERAAKAAGVPLDTWLNQLIKYVSAMELKGKAPAGDNGFGKTTEAAAREAGEASGGPPESDPPLGGWDSEGDAAGSDAPPPTALPPDLLSPSRFEEEPPHEHDIECAIDGWRRAGSMLPVVVRPDGREKGRYEIVTGAERWHAAIRLKMMRVPVAVTALSDDDMMRATLIERLRRRRLSPIEESRTYRRILTENGQNVIGLATDIGCAPSLITDSLQLLDLPDPVQAMLEDGKLTVLHARALLRADDAEAVAREVVTRQLDIYRTEQLVRNRAAPPAETGRTEGMPVEPGGDAAAPDAAEIRMVEKTLSNLLGVKVSIDNSDSAGVLSLRYGNKRGLRDLVSRLDRKPRGS